jgi:hypothetical protein
MNARFAAAMARALAEETQTEPPAQGTSQHPLGSLGNEGLGSDFFGETPSQKLLKRSGECVKNGLGTIFAFPAAAREASPTTGARGYLLSCSRTYSSPLVGLLPTPRLN